MPYNYSKEEILALYDYLWKRSRSLGRGYRFTDEDAQDLSQDVIEKLLEKTGQLDASTNLQAYADTILQNKFRDRWRQNQSRRTSSFSDMELDEEGLEDVPTFGQREFKTGELEGVISRIAELDRQDCRDILYVWIDLVEYALVAAELNIPRGTVMSRISRCKQELIALCRSTGAYGTA